MVKKKLIANLEMCEKHDLPKRKKNSEKSNEIQSESSIGKIQNSSLKYPDQYVWIF